jgi:hypothetical protein
VIAFEVMLASFKLAVSISCPVPDDGLPAEPSAAGDQDVCLDVGKTYARETWTPVSPTATLKSLSGLGGGPLTLAPVYGL